MLRVIPNAQVISNAQVIPNAQVVSAARTGGTQCSAQVVSAARTGGTQCWWYPMLRQVVPNAQYPMLRPSAGKSTYRNFVWRRYGNFA